MRIISFFKNIGSFVSTKRTFNTITKNSILKNEQFKYLKTRHSWHLVDPSPWPLVASLGAFFMTSGGVLYMHNFSGGAIDLASFCDIRYCSQDAKFSIREVDVVHFV